MTNDTASSGFTPNHDSVRIWDLYAVKWDEDDSLWNDATVRFSPNNGIGSGLGVNTIYNAKPVSFTANGQLTTKHFTLGDIDYGSDAALKAHTISAEKHPLKDADGLVYPGLPNLNISNNIMYWSPVTQNIGFFILVLNALLGTSLSINDFVLIRAADGTSVSGFTGSWVGDLTKIEQGKFYEVHVASGVSINLANLDSRFYSNNYIKLANDNTPASTSTRNNVFVGELRKQGTPKNIYDDYFQNIEDIFSLSDKYFAKETLWLSNLPKENYMTSVTNIGATWQVS